MLKCIEDIKPDVVILLGDALDMTPVSHWLQDKRRPLEGKRLLKDYKGFKKDVLTPICKAAKNASIVWCKGNHEAWVDRYIDYRPEVEGMIEPWLFFDDVEWIELNGIHREGHLNYTHGAFNNKYHSYKHVITYGNLIYGHTHTVQTYTEVSPFGHEGVHKATSIGCLCNKNPAYIKGKRTSWVNAFNIAYIFDDGTFNDYTVHIINGRFTFNGKEYRG